MFRKLILSLATAATLGTALVATSGTAEARPWPHRWHPHARIFFHPWRWHPACHYGKVWFHGRWHRDMVCNGRITRIY